jgi:hypothetical protein
MLMPLIGVRKGHPTKYDVVVETVQAELVVAVQATVSISDIARAWKPALNKVWAFLKAMANWALDTIWFSITIRNIGTRR